MLKTQTVTEGIEPSPFTFGYPAARSVVVDNYTSSTLYIADAGIYVAPNSTRVVGLPSPQSTVSVFWQAPPGVQQPVPANGIATLQWSDADAVTSQTTILSSPGFQVSLGVSTGFSTTFKVPPGTQAIMVQGQGNTVSLVGGTSNFSYCSQQALTITTPALIIPFNGSLEQTVIMNIANVIAPVIATALFYGVQEPGFTTSLLQYPPFNSGYTGASNYLNVIQRPTFHIYSQRVPTGLVLAGTILRAAPGVGNSWVVRKIRCSTSNAGTGQIGVGTTLTGLDLACWDVIVGAAATPQPTQFEMDWDDYMIGDNLPICIHGPPAFANFSVVLTYNLVSTGNWPKE